MVIDFERSMRLCLRFFSVLVNVSRKPIPVLFKGSNVIACVYA